MYRATAQVKDSHAFIERACESFVAPFRCDWPQRSFREEGVVQYLPHFLSEDARGGVEESGGREGGREGGRVRDTVYNMQGGDEDSLTEGRKEGGREKKRQGSHRSPFLHVLVIGRGVVVKQLHYIGRVCIRGYLHPSLSPFLSPVPPPGDGEEEVPRGGHLGIKSQGALEGGDGLRE